MSPRQDLARMLRQTLIADAEKVLREYRERTSATPSPPEPAPTPPALLTRARTYPRPPSR